MENGQFTNRTYICTVTVHMLSLSMTVCLIVGMFSQPDVLFLNGQFSQSNILSMGSVQKYMRHFNLES
jgi:hypothetical protein